MPIGDKEASCASQQQALDLSIWCHASQLLLQIAQCIPLSLQFVSSHLISSSHLSLLCLLGVSPFISSPNMFPFLLSALQLFDLWQFLVIAVSFLEQLAVTHEHLFTMNESAEEETASHSKAVSSSALSLVEYIATV